MDAGAHGIIVPMVNTVQDARRAVEEGRMDLKVPVVWGLRGRKVTARASNSTSPGNARSR